jgi:hypothetical protein
MRLKRLLSCNLSAALEKMMLHYTTGVSVIIYRICMPAVSSFPLFCQAQSANFFLFGSTGGAIKCG